MNIDALQHFVRDQWTDSIIPALTDYIAIPNKSPMFDPDWANHGYMDEAVNLMVDWAQKIGEGIRGFDLEVMRLEGRTPLIFIDIPASRAGQGGSVLLYGHLDKQPEMSGWREDLGPWKPVREGDRLYGRGGADDGYALFASLTAVAALAEQGLDYGRCMILIEASEESGSPDLPAYMEALSPRLGTPELVICLDSGAGNYEQMWCTTSLRGLIGGQLMVETLYEGVHSGDAAGIVPDGFQIVRLLLNRLEDAATGEIIDPVFHVTIPDDRKDQAAKAAQVLGDQVAGKFPLAGCTEPLSREPVQQVLNRTWRPALTVIGADGLPPSADAGNVMRPQTTLKLSMRLPPSCDAQAASQRMAELLTVDPPFSARVSFEPDWAAGGWQAPSFQPWLEQAMEQASQHHFGASAQHVGEGFSIPFMSMLSEALPEAQFVITGVLGPGSNAHGPNEFLHLPMAQKLTCCVAEILAAHQAEH